MDQKDHLKLAIFVRIKLILIKSGIIRKKV